MSEFDQHFPLFSFPPSKVPRLLNPLVLAYIGDAIYDTYIRTYLVSLPHHKPNHLHHEATKYVSAKAQAHFLKLWLPHLSEEEQDMVRRGRNAKSATIPKNANVLDYRHSTAFECLIGYLYYKQQHKRLSQLLKMIIDYKENEH
ncbi:Mini-ribonuclease 3 [Chengkuizengella axinellae]|uniref:Mini-ribonuclease 3 n=1 Tax=Chengkuizengella axinellae TaxID=3064388 RepID=A0ABT9J5H2_9BACL|nr:Mini-ribonuclease 3 [Chengkuizengella sp. 2205SS18-9]MDP5276861.1 Mini-ribonuclease 3 [Chengkuizengella sp. 2205SS18-9]